ncbi:hypothetical protein DFH29DRAFT_1008407 [Suillus ampliporus]|nr:hypothetical protein DFH29DRAFT_1008407 [Suillus ampliporus]
MEIFRGDFGPDPLLPLAPIRLDSLYQQLADVLAAIPSPPRPILLSDLSTLARSRVIHALDAAWVDFTFANYHTTLSFGDHERIPPLSCLPASENRICAFAASRVYCLQASFKLSSSLLIRDIQSKVIEDVVWWCSQLSMEE